MILGAEPELSIVVPLHDESEVLGQLVDEVTAAVRPLGRPFELVLVDDGSRDDTAERIAALSIGDPTVVPVLLSRNFGKEAALLAGLEAARGRAVVLMDGDLQHPPTVIPAMLARWDEGYHVVNAVKEDRGREGLAYRWLARGFYALLGGALGEQMQGQSDFKLLDRQVVDALIALPERRRFFRGLVVWVGFHSASVPFRVAPRAAGRTSWSRFGLVRYALVNLVSFSSVPLQAIAWLGFAVTGASGALAAQTLYTWAMDQAVSGFTTTILAVLLTSGAILLCLGVIAVYLAAIYDEIKQRPVYVARRRE
jgi:dolichol-phosphate mannosyltransferase